MKGYNPRYLHMSGKMQDVVVVQQDGEPIVRGRAFTNDSNSPRQQAARTNFGSHGTAFKNLSKVAQSGWLTLARQVHDAGRKRPLSAQNCYTMVNSALQSAGLPTTDTAPTTIDTPSPIQNVTLTTTVGNVHDLSFGLQIHSDDVWAGPILVLGFDAQLLGFDKFERKKAVPLGVIAGLFSGATTVTNLFTDRFGIPESGTKVALQLVRVSPNGFKSSTTFMEAPYLLTETGAAEGGDLHAA